jgi:hypothetical protein
MDRLLKRLIVAVDVGPGRKRPGLIGPGRFGWRHPL